MALVVLARDSSVTQGLLESYEYQLLLRFNVVNAVFQRNGLVPVHADSTSHAVPSSTVPSAVLSRPNESVSLHHHHRLFSELMHAGLLPCNCCLLACVCPTIEPAPFQSVAAFLFYFVFSALHNITQTASAGSSAVPGSVVAHGNREGVDWPLCFANTTRQK